MRESDIEQDIIIPAGGGIELPGNLNVPRSAKGIVVFAHGSGSSRLSPRNQYVAKELNKSGLSTLLIDLLSPEEELDDMRTRRFRFDIQLLATRLCEIGRYLHNDPLTSKLRIGLFGASTGGGAALVAAAMEPKLFDAVVSRGGRPDLAGELLPTIKAPTLLLVGGWDADVHVLNVDAMSRLGSPVKKLHIIPKATHLFEEPGKLEEVAGCAIDWFQTYLNNKF